MPTDPDQLALDLQAARERLALLARQQEKIDNLEERVRDLTRELKSARRLLREAKWDFAATLRHNARRGQGGAK